MLEKTAGFSSRPGLHPNPDDLRWLSRVRDDGWHAVPHFNRSRLIALSLVQPSREGVTITPKGEELLNVFDATAR